MATAGVYAILNLFNDRIYVGSAKDVKDRFSWHYNALEKGNHHSILLQRAWIKYGEQSFIFFMIEQTEDLLNREQYWMDRLASHNVDSGYNIYPVAGSPAKSKHTEETKAKISAAGEGRKLSEETKKRMSEYHKNRSPEHRAKHSEAMKKRVFTPEHRQKLVEANARIKARKQLTEGN